MFAASVLHRNSLPASTSSSRMRSSRCSTSARTAEVDWELLGAGLAFAWVGGASMGWAAWILRGRRSAVEKHGPLAEPQKTPWVFSDGYLRYQRGVSWVFLGSGVAMIAVACMDAVARLAS